MPQYKIPQKAQREDKILGPLTAKQLTYVILTVVSSFILFQTANSNPFFLFNQTERILIVLPLLLLGLSFAFIQVNERPFEIFFYAFLHFLRTPKVRVWQKETLPLIDAVEPPSAADRKQEKSTAAPAPLSRAEIARLSQMMDQAPTSPEKTPTQAPAPTGPTSKTLELLQAVEKKVPESGDNMQVFAKKKTGLGSKLSAALAKTQDAFFGGGKSGNKLPPRNEEGQNTKEPALAPTAPETLPPPANPPDPIHENAAPPQGVSPDTAAKLQELLKNKPGGRPPATSANEIPLPAQAKDISEVSLKTPEEKTADASPANLPNASGLDALLKNELNIDDFIKPPPKLTPPPDASENS